MIRAISRDRARVTVLALAAFVLAHNLLFLLTYGASYGAALAQTGHGATWSSTGFIVFALGIALLAAGTFRLVALSRLARELGAGAVRGDGTDIRAYLGHLARAWPAIFALSVLVYVGWENAEHLARNVPAPGLGVLGAGHGMAVPLLAAVALVAALVDALYRWRQHVLVARIAAARARCYGRSTPPIKLRPPWVERRHAAIVGHRVSGRAPPISAR